MSDDKELVLRTVRDEEIRFVSLWFTDVLGNLKNFTISVDELETALEEGMGFDGSSVEGYARIEESDVIAKPDPMTFTILPWRSVGDRPVARMFCDVLEPDGTPYDGDPRGALKRNLARAEQMGYQFLVGPELEFFYFRNDTPDTEVLDHGGYFDLTPLDVASDLRRDTVLALEKMGIHCEYSHHEVAPSQHEIDLRYMDALSMADAAMTYRLTVKEVAMKHGVYATFMPKPLEKENGSGMHVHQSLFKDGENAFYDAEGKYHLSDVGQSYIAGLLKHAREICCVVAQWVNSYKRLVPGYEAPVYVTWGRRNRSTLVRVPMYKPGKANATRAEFRCPDPACNPYLAFSVMLAAGLEGIEAGYELGEPTEKDIYQMPPEERAKHGITSLPGSLAEAIAEAERSDIVRAALGDHIFEKFIASKRIEWEDYRTHVSTYELERYLPIL